MNADDPAQGPAPRVAELHTPAGAAVKIIERGSSTPVVFLHSGVGSAGEWRQVFDLWPEGHRLVAVEQVGPRLEPAPGSEPETARLLARFLAS